MSDNAAWVREDNAHLLSMEKEKTKQVEAKAEARASVWVAVIISFAVTAVVLGLVAAIWTAVDRSASRAQQEITECTQSGGTIFDLKSGGRVCLHLEGTPQESGS